MGRRSAKRCSHWRGCSLPVLCLLGLIAGCGNQKPTPQTPIDAPPTIALKDIPWCGAPAVRFEDVSTNPATAVTTWSAAQNGLGFAVRLPPALPANSCLLLAGGTLHDPVFGGRFSITYRLSAGGALSLAEAQQVQPQPTLLCSDGGVGATSTTHITTCRQTQKGLDITLASTAPESQLRTWIAALAPDIAWLPANSPTTTPSPTPAKP